MQRFKEPHLLANKLMTQNFNPLRLQKFFDLLFIGETESVLNGQPLSYLKHED